MNFVKNDSRIPYKKYLADFLTKSFADFFTKLRALHAFFRNIISSLVPLENKLKYFLLDVLIKNEDPVSCEYFFKNILNMPSAPYPPE